MEDSISMTPSACTFTASETRSDLNNALSTISEFLKAKSGNLYGLIYSFANTKLQVFVYSNSYADTRHFLVSSSL